MDKSMAGKRFLLTPEKAATFIPVFLSSVISILVIVFFVMPQYSKSNKVNLELDQLITKKNELDNLKSQYKIINEKYQKLNKEKLKIIELITGKSKLDTLLTKLGEIGRNNNIEFDSIIPKKLIKAAEKKINKKRTIKNQFNLKVDPLFVEGTRKYEIDLSFKTQFIDLLAFLREIEFQDNIILIDEINIESNSKNSDIDNPKNNLEVDMKIIFYGVI